jgi:hypothetical protein
MGWSSICQYYAQMDTPAPSAAATFCEPHAAMANHALTRTTQLYVVVLVGGADFYANWVFGMAPSDAYVFSRAAWQTACLHFPKRAQPIEFVRVLTAQKWFRDMSVGSGPTRRGGTLSGVTYDGTLDLSASSTLYVANGLPARGLVSRVTPVHTALRNCTGDEGRPFGFGDQALIPSHRKLLSSKAMVVNVAETSGQ